MNNGRKFELWSEMERGSLFFSLIFTEERAVCVDVWYVCMSGAGTCAHAHREARG